MTAENGLDWPVDGPKTMQTDPLDLSMKTLATTHHNQSSDTSSSDSYSPHVGDSDLMIVCDEDHHHHHHHHPEDSVVVGVDVHVDHHSSHKPPLSKSKERRFVCLMCSYDCKSELALQKHTSRMHSVKTTNGRVRCAVCGGSFESLEELQAHQAATHNTSTSSKLAFYSCNHCKKQFRSEKQLAAHRRLLDKKNSWKEGVGKHVSKPKPKANKSKSTPSPVTPL